MITFKRPQDGKVWFVSFRDRPIFAMGRQGLELMKGLHTD